MSLLVLEPGLESRLVDLGRPRSRSLGVPVGGAADRRSLVLGNSLLGNAPEAAALEIALKGPRLRANADVGCLLFGAPFAAHVDDHPIAIGRTFLLTAGQELQIGGAIQGARVYLCVWGGFKATTILGSRSALEPIRSGDRLECESSTVRVRFLADMDLPKLVPDAIAVVPGLQASWFEEAEFYDQSFTVTPASNRMGLRLSGMPLTMPKCELISEAVCPGAVQVTSDGQCIVLGVDGQTIGGYPKIAQVIQADLDAIGQLRPGQQIRFTAISLSEAIERDRAAYRELRSWSLRLRNAN